jgi:HlyD family secretion protein
MPRFRAVAAILLATLVLPAPGVQAQSRIKALIERLRGDTMPDGIVKTNGRIEATQVDVSSKYAGRLAEVTVKEGDEVTAGQVIARIASPEYEAQLRSAQAQVLRARQALAEAEALIAQRKSDQILARTDAERGKELVAKGYLSKQVDDQRSAKADAADAALRAAQAQRDQAQFAIHASEADAEQIKAILVDLVLLAPRSGVSSISSPDRRSGRGRHARRHDPRPLGRLHDDLSAGRAGGQLALGDEARIILDPVPQYVIPATVSFVAADAQFTPKAVETAEEREKLVFRAKLQSIATCSRNIIGR